ncbi:MAG: winged helix-turn-helix transcriptional regulator [bacterium]|nr:winged helix-turn-helix transcriptional regulator [bacterium]
MTVNITEKNFLYNLSSIRKRAFSFLEYEMKLVGVTDIPPSYGDILYVLKSKNGLALKEISEKSYKDKSTVSLIVNALEKKEYVVKTKDSLDARSVRIKLTEKALQHVDDVAGISVKLQNKLFSGMSEEEKTELFRLLNKITVNM